MALATHEDVARLARRDLTPEEQVFATEAIDALTATLERKLNRILDPREITETVRVARSGELLPSRGPVVEVLSATSDGAPFHTNYLSLWDQIAWPPGYDVEVTYLAGREPDAGLRDTVAGAVARTLAQPAIVATGVVGSYSVEGTSITYRTGEQTEAGGLLVGELRGIGRLRRPVLL